jgi:hypothetical protein
MSLLIIYTLKLSSLLTKKRFNILTTQSQARDSSLYNKYFSPSWSSQSSAKYCSTNLYMLLYKLDVIRG